MKKYSLKKSVFILRACIAGFILAILSLFLFSFTVSSKLGDDLWKLLGITQQQGSDQIRNSFLNNYFDYYAARNAKNILGGNRAAVAKSLLAYTKQVISSPAFAREYEKQRAGAKPAAPETKGRTKEEIRKEKIDETREQIKKTEEILKTADASVREAMQGVLQIYQQNLKDYQDPGNEMIGLFYQQELLMHEADMDRYREDYSRWEEAYPAEVNVLLRNRLRKYLDLAATVDFEAALTERNGKKKFVRQEYEAKNTDWKMIYRAGKEVYEAARPFAEQWIKELDR